MNINDLTNVVYQVIGQSYRWFSCTCIYVIATQINTHKAFTCMFSQSAIPRFRVKGLPKMLDFGYFVLLGGKLVQNNKS